MEARRAGCAVRKGRSLMEKHSLSHTSWECVCHIVWIPKHGRKVLYGEARREIGEILRMLVERTGGVEIVEGSTCRDHVHICLRVPPKYAPGGVVGKLKGRCSIILHERHPEWRGLTGRDRTLWARGYYAGTIGLDEAKVRQYVRNQEEGSRIE